MTTKKKVIIGGILALGLGVGTFFYLRRKKSASGGSSDSGSGGGGGFGGGESSRIAPNDTFGSPSTLVPYYPTIPIINIIAPPRSTSGAGATAHGTGTTSTSGSTVTPTPSLSGGTTNTSTSGGSITSPTTSPTTTTTTPVTTTAIGADGFYYNAIGNYSRSGYWNAEAKRCTPEMEYFGFCTRKKAGSLNAEGFYNCCG